MCKLKVYTVTTMCFGALFMEVHFDFLTLLTIVVPVQQKQVYIQVRSKALIAK